MSALPHVQRNQEKRRGSSLSNRSSIRWFVNHAALALVAAQWAIHAAWAGDINRVVHIDITSQPLAAALTTLAKQSDLHILFTPAIVDGLQAASLSGSYSASQALRALLANTQLEFVMEGENTIVVRERKPMLRTEGSSNVRPTLDVAY